uniref:RING-type domain-containing protein n=1 Tax=Parascaris equorum TaxID=6256 RepID=A0A914RGG5_PAREQ
MWCFCSVMCSWFYCLIFSIHFTLLFYILKLRHTLGEPYDDFGYVCIVCECISKDQYMCTRCGQLCGCEKCVGEMLSSSTRTSCPLCRLTFNWFCTVYLSIKGCLSNISYIINRLKSSQVVRK